MAYKFNGGYGAVICDECRVMFDEGLSPGEYEATYGPTRDAQGGKDLCWRHKTKPAETRPEPIE